MNDHAAGHPATTLDPLAERAQKEMANTKRHLDRVGHYLEGADRGLQHRQDDLKSPGGWSPAVRESIVDLVRCHRGTLEESLGQLERAASHLTGAYRDAMAMSLPPHLTPANRDQVVGTLADTVEVTVAIEMARPHIESAVAQLRHDPASLDRLAAARVEIGDALPYLDNARRHAAAAAEGDPDEHTAEPSVRTQRPGLPPSIPTSHGIAR